MLEINYNTSLKFARELDSQDALHSFRSHFHFPRQDNGESSIYLCGNSLGLQSKHIKSAIVEELVNWEQLGVEGHFQGKHPWVPYHENLAESMARVVGAKASQVVVMNTLTVNLHLMLVSFYRPLGKRNKILIEADAFPSDKYAVESQIRFHGLDPNECLIQLKAKEGETCLQADDIHDAISKHGEEISLILFGNTNYYTGQFFDMKQITSWGHERGCFVGFDCAHGAGNLPLNLHDSGCDFAVWCTYKYLNSGPGAMGGVFVNERHHHSKDMPRLEGWWGHNKHSRFNMRGGFDPIPTAEAWQLSCPPIFSMAPIWASLKLFDEAGMDALRNKSIALTGYLEFLVKSLGDEMVDIITPSDPNQRGSQLSIRMKQADKSLFDRITEKGVIVDWREPDVIRVAPAAIYNSFEDVFRFFEILKSSL